MKKYFMVLFVLTFCLVTSVNILAQDDGCEISIPDNAKLVRKATTLLKSNQVYVIGKYIDVTVVGSNNLIIVRKGSTVTVPGSENRLFVSSICTISLPGSNNQVVADRSCNIEMLGSNNSIKRCDKLIIYEGDDPQPRRKSEGGSELGDAVKILSDIGAVAKKVDKASGKKRGKKDGELVEATAHPSNNLIGTWDVVSAYAMGQELTTSGKIILNKRGLGYQDYVVTVLGEKYPQIGLFKWRSDDSTVFVNENEDFASVWKRLVNKKNFHRVEVQLEDGVKAQLALQRIK
jgi:hypothetical protein